jgi:diacylglycerol kinase (ATP)
MTDTQHSDPSQTEREPAVSQFKSKSGFKRIFSAFFYSLDGFRAAWRHEHAFRQELIIAVPGVLIALLLPVSVLEKLVLIGVLVLVLVIELLNSAIEAVVDRVSLDRNPLSKNAKDLGSAAVMLSFAFALLTWGVIVLPLLLG